MEKTPSILGMLLRLGLVIGIALYIFLSFAFKIFDVSFDKRELEYTLLFEHATGVEHNTQVELSGFKIGHVTSIQHIKTENKTMAKVNVVVNKKYQPMITDQAHFFVAQRKFIGLTFIQVIPTLEGRVLKNKDSIQGVSPPRYNLLFSHAKELLIYFNAFLKKSHFNELLAEVDGLSQNLKGLKKDVDGQMRSMKHQAKLLVKQIKKLKKVYFLHERQLKADGKEIGKNVNQLLDKKDLILVTLNQSEGVYEEAMNLKDTALYSLKKHRPDFDRSVKNIEQIITQIETFEKQTKDLKDVLDLGIGNIGLFLHDKEIYDYSRFIFKIIKQESYRYFLPLKHKVE